MESIKINTKKDKEIIDITDRINEILAAQDMDEGMIFLFTKHTTCSLTTADLDPGTDKDYIMALEELIPDLNYNHPHDPSHVSDHINSTIIGPGVTLPFVDNKMDLGTWQKVVLIELNGPRVREIVVRYF